MNFGLWFIVLMSMVLVILAVFFPKAIKDHNGKTDYAFWALSISGLMLVFAYSSLVMFLEKHKLIGLIDDGKTHDRMVWLPIDAPVRTRFDFSNIKKEDKEKLIAAMNREDIKSEIKIIQSLQGKKE